MAHFTAFIPSLIKSGFRARHRTTWRSLTAGAFAPWHLLLGCWSRGCACLALLGSTKLSLVLLLGRQMPDSVRGNIRRRRIVGVTTADPEVLKISLQPNNPKLRRSSRPYCSAFVADQLIHTHIVTGESCQVPPFWPEAAGRG